MLACREDGTVCLCLYNAVNSFPAGHTTAMKLKRKRKYTPVPREEERTNSRRCIVDSSLKSASRSELRGKPALLGDSRTCCSTVHFLGSRILDGSRPRLTVSTRSPGNAKSLSRISWNFNSTDSRFMSIIGTQGNVWSIGKPLV
uniref:Uncharacterized protein n=1 Tax=Vespula pensylvanica TaxID=30213 RepID=A0A834UAI2_VESPE|nr:hypothetical protein H0235_008211 [Vespula pensylvanica]